MFDLFEKIEEAIRELLTNFVSSNLTTMFTDVNDKTGTIAAEVGQTPQAWNSGIFNMIESLSNSVIIPIAGMIITFVLCYELISMVKMQVSIGRAVNAEISQMKQPIQQATGLSIRKRQRQQWEVSTKSAASADIAWKQPRYLQQESKWNLLLYLPQRAK